MKEIIHNDNNIKGKDINNIIKRAKIVLINNEDEILLANSNNNYYLIGGHVEKDETDIETLEREILEETGIELKLSNIKAFLRIIHRYKNYPKEKDITESSINYYYLKTEKKINQKNMALTEEEIEENFKVSYIKKDKIIDILKENLKIATRPSVVKDTLNAIEEFLRIYK